MNDIVIKAENIGKKYTIGHNSGNSRYMAFRDVVMQTGRTLWNRTKDLVSGNPVIQGDIIEEIWAVRDLNFEIKRGEAVGIIGRNGAGKSTLLKILSRITEPSSGRVTIDGRVASLLEVGTGFHPELTGRENIYLNGTILGMTRNEIKHKFDEIVAFAEVEKYLDTPVKRYSSGMYVRLAFAVAAHLEPEILVVDEVLAVGDVQFQKKCLGKMNDVTNTGRTLLFVSHNMGAIHQLCPHSFLLEAGSLIMHGETPLVINSYLQNNFANSDSPEKIFQPNDRKKLQLLSVRLTNARGETIRIFDCDNAIYIELVIKINIPDSGYYGYLQISRVDGTVVLVSDSNDIRKNSFDGLKHGINKVVLSVPPRSLGAGTYSLYLNFTDSEGNALDSPQTVCTFNLDDISTSRGNTRGGFLSTLIPWEIKK